MSDAPISAEDVRELEELFKQHPSLRELHERQQSDPAEEALRRVALARTFTRDLYENVLRADLDLEFDKLIMRPEVEPVPQKAGYYWLRESDQRAAAESWAQNPQKRMYWAERIYQHAKSSRAEPLELAIQQLRFDPESARVEIRKLYDSADDANDLPQCHLIVETLGPLKAEMAGMPMDDDRREYSSRYSARAMFLVEYHRSAAYFSRPEPAEAFDKVLAEAEGRWILHLFAAGGMGKTMFLEWTISHSLVTSPERALVARLDMDFLSVNALTRCPWLMAIEIGRQIDQQLPAPAFDKFLASLTSFGGLLYSPLSERYQALSRRDVQDLIQVARNLSTHWSRFASILASLPRDRKIVILLDTIEEASLYYSPELRAIIGQFEELKLKQPVPQLRLVLSGRYQLGREHLVDSWDETVAAATRLCEIQPFSSEVAAQIARARLPGKPDDLVKAIVRSAGGFPFKLAILVELVLDDPSIKACQIEKYRDADVAYVIERVIKRIGLNDTRRGEDAGGTANEHQSLRWVVRYGAIPRKLTLSFLKNVMKPHLDRALTGEAKQSGDDDPEQDVWYPDPDANCDPDALWKELTNYSSQRGWITVDSHDPELASFHSDIVNPLRRLLREQRVFVPLHRDAAKHYGARAENEPDRWAEWKAAELYHLSESGEETSRMRVALLEARQREPSAQLSLYNDVLEHRDFEGLGSEVRAEVHLARADAMVANGDYDYALAGTARELVKTNVLVTRTLQQGEITPFWKLWLSVDEETPADLLRNLQAMQFATNLTDADRQRLCLLLASVHPETSARLEVLETGLSIAESARNFSALIPAWVFRRRLSQEHERAGNLVAARETAATAVKELEGTQNPARLNLAARIATIDLSMLRLERADQVILSVGTGSVELARLNARLHLLIGNPWRVQADLMQRQQEPEDLLLHAEAAAQQLRITESLAMFDRAEQAFEHVGSISGMNRVRISRLRFLTLEAGIEPRTALGDCPPSDPPTESEILRAYGNMERPSHAASILQSLERHESPAVRARGLIAGLVWGITRPSAVQEAGRQLVETVEKIQPASGRLALLDPPLLDGSFPLLDEELVRKLEELFFAKPESSSEAGIYCLRYADLQRALGRYSAALDLLRQIHHVPTASKENLWPLMALRRRRLIEDRIRAVRPETPIEVDPLTVWEPFRDDPVLYAAVLVETAERALGAGDVATVHECLQGAKPVLETHTRFAQQYRRVEDALTTSGSGAPEMHGARLAHSIVVITRQSRRLAVWNSNVARWELISIVEDPALEVVAAVGSAGISGMAAALTDLIVRDWRTVANQFDKVVSSPWIMVPDPQLAGVPWELCAQQVVRLVIEDHTLRSELDQMKFEPSQLTDSLTRQWRAARHEVDPPSELVWLALPEGTDAESRSAGAYADLPRRFQDAGMTPVLLANAISEKQVPGLVYLGCGIEQTQAIPRLTSGGLTAVTLGSMLATARTATRPVVILDPPRPYSLSEAVECLYWRNLLAHQLMSTGTVAAVFAIGLAPFEEQGQNIERLLRALHERTSLTRLLEDVRASASDEDPIDRIVAFCAAALFTLDPSQRFGSGPGVRQ
jgi:hypothetical protein